MAPRSTEARARGAERVWLEVIVENTQAVALYEALGYEHVRDVEVWSLAGGDGPPPSARRGGARLDPRAPHGPRAVAARRRSLAHQDEHAWAGGRRRGRASSRSSAGRRQRRSSSRGDASRCGELLAGARSLGDPLVGAQPARRTPGGVALAALGGRVDVRQHELVLAL